MRGPLAIASGKIVEAVVIVQHERLAASTCRSLTVDPEEIGVSSIRGLCCRRNPSGRPQGVGHVAAVKYLVKSQHQKTPPDFSRASR